MLFLSSDRHPHYNEILKWIKAPKKHTVFFKTNKEDECWDKCPFPFWIESNYYKTVCNTHLIFWEAYLANNLYIQYNGSWRHYPLDSKQPPNLNKCVDKYHVGPPTIKVQANGKTVEISLKSAKELGLVD